MHNRRKLVAALGAGMVTVPFSTFAQTPPKVWRIGVLNPFPPPVPGAPNVFVLFFEALRDLGYVDGRNIAVQSLSADNHMQRLPELAAQLVKSKVDLIVTIGTPAVQAAKQTTATIPIIALGFGDPVAFGFAKSLARPGGNITGMTLLGGELHPKRLEILVEIVPRVTRIAYLMNPDNPSQVQRLPLLENAARKANKEIVFVNAAAANELSSAFAKIARERADALMVANDSVLIDHGRRIGELALQHRLPSMFASNTGIEHGLVSYDVDFIPLARSAARMAVKIFKGAKPADIPIERPTHFTFGVNMKIARALGITIPPAIMVQATRVIE